MTPTFLHASAVVVGEAGVLIEGPSGSGKTSLAEALLVEADRAGWFGCLVGDDRIGLVAMGGRLVARPHPAVAGLIERRGTGIVAVPHEAACLLALVVELVVSGTIERLPERPPVRSILGIDLPLLRLPAAGGPAVNAQRAWRATQAIAPRCVHPF